MLNVFGRHLFSFMTLELQVNTVNVLFNFWTEYQDNCDVKVSEIDQQGMIL